MAPVQTPLRLRVRPGPPARPATADRPPGHVPTPAHPTLAEVIPLRLTAGSTERRLAGFLLKIAQVFASLRAQAASGDTSPRPPTSPAPFLSAPSPTASDDDAA
jgi:hypothetical protein